MVTLISIECIESGISKPRPAYPDLNTILFRPSKHLFTEHYKETEVQFHETQRLVTQPLRLVSKNLDSRPKKERMICHCTGYITPSLTVKSTLKQVDLPGPQNCLTSIIV